ncbi:hypothetical protein VB618_06020 [Microvirga sp. CF3062]|nr:hypothetical protein [Microvirga sp. CF3062]MEE1655744.1 hypothetical protein [Microvirga sp. CF3062]
MKIPVPTTIAGGAFIGIVPDKHKRVSIIISRGNVVPKVLAHFLAG